MRGVVAAGAVVGALLIAGCGDDSNGEEGGEPATAATASTTSSTATNAESTSTTTTSASTDDGEESSGPLTKAEYEERYRALADEIDAAIADIEKSASGASPGDFDAFSTAFRDFAGYLEQAAADLDALEPPPDIAEAHQGYADVLAMSADAYAELADAVAGADSQEEAAGATQVLQELYSDPEVVRKVGAFAEALEAGNYDIRFSYKPGQPVP